MSILLIIDYVVYFVIVTESLLAKSGSYANYQRPTPSKSRKSKLEIGLECTIIIKFENFIM